MDPYSSFKKNHIFKERYEQSKKMISKYQDKVPIICESCLTSTHNYPPINKKFMVPKDFTIGEFLCIIRNKLSIGNEKAIFLFIDNNVLSPTSLVGDIYYRHRSTDLILYISYSEENVFG